MFAVYMGRLYIGRVRLDGGSFVVGGFLGHYCRFYLNLFHIQTVLILILANFDHRLQTNISNPISVTLFSAASHNNRYIYQTPPNCYNQSQQCPASYYHQYCIHLYLFLCIYLGLIFVIRASCHGGFVRGRRGVGGMSRVFCIIARMLGSVSWGRSNIGGLVLGLVAFVWVNINSILFGLF